MKFFGLGIVFALASQVVAEGYICETSDASPLLHHIDWMVDNMNKENVGVQQCLSYSLGGEKCSKTRTKWSDKGRGGGAAWALCKHGDNQAFRCARPVNGPPCITGCGGLGIRAAAGHIAKIRDKCKRKDSKGAERAGGIYRFVDGGELSLFTIGG